MLFYIKDKNIQTIFKHKFLGWIHFFLINFLTSSKIVTFKSLYCYYFLIKIFIRLLLVSMTNLTTIIFNHNFKSIIQ